MSSSFDFTNQKIVILGLARQGLALARFFVQAGAQVVISDMASADRLADELTLANSLPVEIVLGEHPLTLLDGCDLLCLSGGVPPQIEIVQTAIARKIPLSNDSLLTMQLARQRGLGPIVAITGSSGKTTTTTLVGLMLAESGKVVHIGGNIGTPLLDRMDTIQPGECIVLELSSFQLELFDPTIAWGSFQGIGPDVAAILNITPNHLDRHPGMAAYAAAKLNLLRYLPASANVVLNAEDPITENLLHAQEHLLPNGSGSATWALDSVVRTVQSALFETHAVIVGFSQQAPLPQGAWLEGNRLVYNGQAFCTKAEIHLRGDHNISNLLAAAAISGAAGASCAAMGKVACTFTGVPHRLQVVAQSEAATWINDSIATAPERTVAALRSFTPGEQTLILLVGGKDKNLPWETFADEALARVNFLIGFGHAGAMIINLVQEHARYTKRPAPNCAVVQRLDEAVELAARVAFANPAPANLPLTDAPILAAQPHTVVLLSPGGTSYDAYRDFEARGEHFQRLIDKWMAPKFPVNSHQ